jgi:hypothetical protein
MPSSPTGSPTPVPAPVPSVPTGYPGYINSSTSGVLPTTGTSACNFSGPWMIETQTMEITYVRIPHYHDTSPTISLSGNPSQPYSINRTELVAKAVCNVSKQYVPEECYQTSSWQQTQKFAIVAASADHNGSSYGMASAFTASTLGPAGSIVTYQPYYHRRPWVSTDTTFASSVEVHNTALATKRCGFEFSSNNINQVFWNNYEDKFYFGSPTPARRRSQIDAIHYGAEAGWKWNTLYPDYQINGQYDYNKESMYSLTSFVDQFGYKTQAEALYPEVPEFSNSTNQSKNIHGLPEYVPTRHDWS